jgi:hypothetical protein
LALIWAYYYKPALLDADFAEAKYKSICINHCPDVAQTLVDTDDGFTNDFTQHGDMWAFRHLCYVSNSRMMETFDEDRFPYSSS